MSILMDVKELQRGGEGVTSQPGLSRASTPDFGGVPVVFGSQIETSDSARKKVVRRAPLYPIHTQLGLERLKRWGGRG